MHRELVRCFVIWQLFSFTVSTNPCDRNGHRRIPNEGLRYINFKVPTGDPTSNDFSLLESWYYVGNDKMPEHPPDGPYSCGTKFPIWLNGSHPTTNKIITQTACLLSVSSNCSKSYDVRIKLCPKNFFLYYLKPTSSHTEGYCFGVGKKGTATKYVAPTPTAKHSLKTEFIKTVPVSRVIFICDFIQSTSERLWYQVSWLREGKVWLTTTFANHSKDASLLLTEATFLNKGFAMGEKISCAVRAFKVQHGPPSKMSPASNEMFVGIQVITPILSFRKDEKDVMKKTIRIKPTVHIGCFATTECTIWLTAYTPKQYQNRSFDCPSGVVLDRKACGIKLFSTNYSSEYHIPITTAETGKYASLKDVTYEIYLQTDERPEPTIWNKYKLPPIKVNVMSSISKEVHSGKTCHAHIDPHMMTFDGGQYDNHQPGVYIMYRNEKFDAEIQIKHQYCNSRYPNQIQCPCGIAASIGSDRYVINVCGRTLDVGFKECGDGVIVAKRKDERNYKVIFPYGTYADISLVDNPFSGWNAGKFVMNIDVKPSVHDDKSASKGLCGRLNGNCLDDYHYRNGGDTHENTFCCRTWSCHRQPLKFIKDWKITSLNENLFSDKFIKNGKPWVRRICSCEKGETKITGNIPCQQNTVATCTTGKTIGQHSCNSPTRRRRSVGGNPIIPTVKMPFSIDKWVKKRSTTKNMTEAQATEFCTKHLNSSSIFSSCEQVPHAEPKKSIETCILDIMLTGAPDWADSARETMRMSCLSELERNTSLWVATKGSTPIAEIIEDKACSNNCSGLGKCVKGKCECQNGHGGSDCSLDLSKGPTISGLLDNGLCDEKSLKCDHAYVFGHTFVDGNNLTCRMEEFSISLNGTRREVSTHFLLGELETFIEVICPVQMKRRKRSIVVTKDHTEFVFGYKISVSNDGNHFQPGHDLFVYNSECQTVTNISGTWHFTLKNGYCFIDNKCVPDGSHSKIKNCSICDSKFYKTSWATDSSIQGCAALNTEEVATEDNDNYLWVIGVVAGFVAGAIIAIVVVVKLTSKRAKKKVSDSAISLQPSETVKAQ